MKKHRFLLWLAAGLLGFTLFTSCNPEEEKEENDDPTSHTYIIDVHNGESEEDL